MSEWQPIETAPKDGTEFQAWVVLKDRTAGGFWEPKCRFNEHGAFEIFGRVDYDEDGWDCFLHLEPTHWMPLPEPPK